MFEELASNFKNKYKVLISVILVLALFFIGLGFVQAAIPDTSGVIHGCYKNSNGSLRIFDDAVDACSSNETELTWNQTGPQGPPGPSNSSFVESKRLFVPHTYPNGDIYYPFLAIPEFGEITVACGSFDRPDGSIGGVNKGKFLNTSGQTVYVEGPGVGTVAVPNGGTVDELGHSLTQPGYLFSFGDGQSSKAGTLTLLFASNTPITDGCTFRGFASFDID